MNTRVESQLETLSQQILYHRKKAADYRKRAAAQDAIADAKVKEAAKLGTGMLPLLSGSESNPPYIEGMEGDPRGSYTADGTFRMD